MCVWCGVLGCVWIVFLRGIHTGDVFSQELFTGIMHTCGSPGRAHLFTPDCCVAMLGSVVVVAIGWAPLPGWAPHALLPRAPTFHLRAAGPAIVLRGVDDLTSGQANAMYDTVDAVDRPDVWESFDGRDKLTVAFLAHGAAVSAVNIAGAYTPQYNTFAVGVAASLGLSSAAWGWYDLATGGIPDDERPGFAHERSIISYTTSYLAGALWLSLRFSPLYPVELTPLDPPICVASVLCYTYGLAAPVYTALALWDQLTLTEQLRMKGMIVSGAVGAVFILETLALLLNGGQGWWERVLMLYPAQDILEPSVTLFAAYAVEAGMLIHRSARRGTITFEQAVSRLHPHLLLITAPGPCPPLCS